MSMATKLPGRHPNVPFRRVPLSEAKAEEQIQRGIYMVEGGVPYPIPVDRIRDIQDGSRGFYGGSPSSVTFLNRELWRSDADGRVFRPGTRMEAPNWRWVPKMWAAANAVTNGKATQIRNMLAFGHDVHVSTFGNLYGRHFHSGWANPFEPDLLDFPLDMDFKTMRATHFPEAHRMALESEMNGLRYTLRAGGKLDKSQRHRLHQIRDKELPVIREHVDCKLGEACPALTFTWGEFEAFLRSRRGFVEDLGWLSGAKVSDAFVSEEIDELVSATSSEYADFDYHEVGTASTAEDNNDTALGTSSGISRVTGTPTDSDPDYVNVGTITADATETWEEHGLFNNSTSVALMDRSLTGGQAVNSSDQVEYTYTLTKNPEA